MAEKVKRSLFATFIDVDPGYEDWALVGEGVTTATIEYNPEISEEVYIHQDSATAEIERYGPKMPLKSKAVFGDDVFDYVDGLRINQAVLNDAHTQVVNVWLYKPVSGQTDTYEAELRDATISIESFGGDGGQTNEIDYTIHYRGDPVLGEFNIDTLTFDDGSSP